MNQELPDVQAGFRKGRTRDKLPQYTWIIEKAMEFKKKPTSLIVLKPLTVWITTNCGIFLMTWKYQKNTRIKNKIKKIKNTRKKSHCLPSEKPLCRIKSNS